MDCPEIPILAACIGGTVAGGLFYWIASHRRQAFSGMILLEALIQGSLLAGALHLMYCILCPGQLVELIDAVKHTPIGAGAVVVKVDSVHSVEIFIASLMLLVLSFRTFKTIWQKPGH